MIYVFPTMLVFATIVAFLIRIGGVWAEWKERRVEPKPNEMPWERVRDDQVEYLDPDFHRLRNIRKTGQIYPGYTRYKNGMVVNDQEGTIIWPNSDGTYDWIDQPFPEGLKQILETIIKLEQHELGKINN